MIQLTKGTASEIKGVIEKLFARPGMVDSLRPAIEKASASFGSTALANIKNHWEQLADNWSGVQVDVAALGSERANYLESKRAFSEDLANRIASGIIPIEKRTVLGGYKITIPKHTGSGSGIAAATLIAAALEENGITPIITERGETVVVIFKPGKTESSSIDTFISNVKELDEKRAVLLK